MRFHQDPIQWPIGRTTMTLKMATDPEGNLQESEVITLLHMVTKACYAHPSDAPLTRAVWFRDPFKRGGPRFTIAPPPVHRVLTWKHVAKIAESLLEYYREQEAWPQLVYQVDDPKQGIVGSGVLRQGIEGTARTT